MQFSYRIIAIILVFLILFIFMHSFYSISPIEETQDDKILRHIADIESKVSQYLSQVQSYRSELMTVRNELVHTNNTSLRTYKHINDTHRLKLFSIYNALPHLMDYEDSLTPPIIVGKERRDVSILIGIPTVKRPTQSYLLTTLQNLLKQMNQSEKNDTLVIIFIAETDPSFIQSTINSVRKQFKEDVESGLIELISPSPNFYPDLKEIKETLGDSVDRTRWRSKQNLDYAYLMLYAQHRSTYYVQLEDDVLSKEGFIETMKSFALKSSTTTEQWLMLDFCQLGFIGKLFRSSDLWRIAEFFLLFYKDKPGDWLLFQFFSVKYCKLDQNNKKCLKELEKHWIHYKCSLFQHIGMVSSLSGKVQKLKDKKYGKLELFIPHSNPAAHVESNIKHYGKFSLEKAYEGKTYFWGLAPQAGDKITFFFQSPINVESYRIITGNAEHPSDRIYNCSFGIITNKPFLNSDSLKNTEEFLYIDEFDEIGTLSGKVPIHLNPVSAFRLLIKSSSDNWIIISEIFFEVAK